MMKTNSSDPAKDDQTTRFRNILRGDSDEEVASPPKSPSSTVPDRVSDGLEAVSRTRSARGLRLPAVNPIPVTGDNNLPASGSDAMSRGKYQSTFWTVTGMVSLVVDVILIAVVIFLLFRVRSLNIRLGELMNLSSMPLETVSGLYSNFEKLNDAHIKTTIAYDSEIPIKFDLPLNQQTEVVLSQDTPIDGARVTLSTGGLEISSAPANIVLPAGTRLPVTLSLTVPVNTKVPVHLLVPVDIELASSELGVPFTGLMDILEPLYCLLDPQAVDARGLLICEKAKSP